ncbi:IclR family transcriptional regulator C-terminal domain-containing protein [Pseudoxanthobacter sp.]|uniref:IclR family transcriptional regulator domain-containing protein n=1 Tax=Pseudoxanthobacter sp. TaxID=1925742 RepID=UPI002FE06024
MEGIYKPVRALERGIAVLTALNRLGRARPSDLAAACEIDRTTTYRLLATLARLDLVARSPSDETWSLAPGVRALSEGLTEGDEISHIVAQELIRLLPQVRWPSDFGSFEGGSIVIRETTHRFSPFSVHRAMVGRYRPLTRSAMGRAILAAAADDERETMLAIAVSGNAADAADAADRRLVQRLVGEVRARGYAASVGGSEASISAIALPVMGRGRVMGAINIIFFRSAMTPEEAAGRHLDALRACVADIERRFAEENAETP